ncbi:MAG: hypothetical protein IKK44_03975 [Clostridium sp.]|nr:hypothetical protein [Clostridium sp.]
MFSNFLLHLGLGAVSDLLSRNAYDKSEGEPLLAEEALVHAKTEQNQWFVIHFYIAARDDVVNCAVPWEIGKYLQKGWRGTLCHQGGQFFSFEHNGELICEDTFYGPPEPY